MGAHLFEELDMTGDGKVNKDMFELAFTIDKVKWFSSIGLDVHEANELFELIEDGEGWVTQADFIEAMKSLRGPARSKDLFLVRRDLRKIQEVMLGAERREMTLRVDSKEQTRSHAIQNAY